MIWSKRKHACFSLASFKMSSCFFFFSMTHFFFFIPVTHLTSSSRCQSNLPSGIWGNLWVSWENDNDNSRIGEPERQNLPHWLLSSVHVQYNNLELTDITSWPLTFTTNLWGWQNKWHHHHFSLTAKKPKIPGDSVTHSTAHTKQQVDCGEMLVPDSKP